MMTRNRFLNAYIGSMSVLGALAIAYSMSLVRLENLSVGLAVSFSLAVLIAPRLNITLPHSGLTLSFADVVIFTGFVFHGGPAAVVLSAVEVLSSSYYLKRKGVGVRTKMVPFNVAIAALSTSASVLIATSLPLSSFSGEAAALVQVIERLFALALCQFVFTSALTALYYHLATDQGFLRSWKTNGIPLAATHIAGGIFAGMIFFVWTAKDMLVASFCFLGALLLYLNYKQVVTRMSDSIDQAGAAERELVETERKKNQELQIFAGELASSLVKGKETLAELTRSRQQFKHAALHDSLTELPNRAYIGEMLKELIAGEYDACQDPDHSHRHATDSSAVNSREAKGYVLFIDLSRFKSVNDTLGHGVGDRVLKIAAQRLNQTIRDGDVAARIGGDEFAVLLRSTGNLSIAEEISLRIHRKISEPISVEGNRINVGVNIGLAPVTSEHASPEEALRDADIAMHYAQARGTGIETFNADLRDASMQRAQVEAELPFAVERGELELHFQPLVSLRDGSLTGLEALLRWNHPKRGRIAPTEFIPVAEESGLIIPMTGWILDQACEALANWQKSSPRHEDLIVSVNISGRHLAHQSLLDDVERVIGKHSLDPGTLKLEITESVAMENASQSTEALNRLKEIGVQLSIDDFGTGYSSLSYLHKLPFDTLKVDRSFVKDVGENGENSEVLRTIIALAKSLDMRVIAEGIETTEQLMLLQSLGCEYGQGFLMAKPAPRDAISELMLEKTSWLPLPNLCIPPGKDESQSVIGDF